MQIKFSDEQNKTIGIVMYSNGLKDKREAVKFIVDAYAAQRGEKVIQ